MANREDKKRRVEEEIQRTLASLDSVAPIEANPFFMTRFWQAVEDRTQLSDNWLSRITLGYKLVPAGLVLFVLLNAATLIVGITGSPRTADAKTVQLREAAQDYYSLGATSADDHLNLSGK